MHGQFVWYELTTPDVDAARKFYPPITGWGTQPFDKDYMMWTSGGAPIAGIFRLGPEQRQKGIPPNWMPYIEANNIDETARRVTSLGGKVMVGPDDIPGTGRFAVVQDPQGAVFGIYKSSNQMSRAWDGTPVVGRFSWHELMTTDYKKAWDFYRQLFGWEKTGEMDMGGGNMYFMYGMKGKPYGGMFNRPPEMAGIAGAAGMAGTAGMPPFWLVYVHVKDVDKAVEATTRTGGMVKQPPMEVPGGRIAILGDPQGAGFAVHAAAPVAASKPAAKKASTAASRPRAKAAKSRPKAKAASKKRPAAKKASRKAKAKPRRRGR
jgi:predicted enzyme related to lactoylglutathione lyase